LGGKMNAVEFDAPFSDALVEAAAKSLVRQSLKWLLGWKLYLAAGINLVAFLFMLVFFPEGPGLWIIGFIAIVPPMYFPLLLTVRSKKVAEILRQRFQPSAHISFEHEGFTVAANGRSTTMQWNNVKEVIEFKDYFLLMLSRIAGVIVPRENIPADGDELVRSIGRARKAGLKET
jgi:hypothetical protein